MYASHAAPWNNNWPFYGPDSISYTIWRNISCYVCCYSQWIFIWEKHIVPAAAAPHSVWCSWFTFVSIIQLTNLLLNFKWFRAWTQNYITHTLPKAHPNIRVSMRSSKKRSKYFSENGKKRCEHRVVKCQHGVRMTAIKMDRLLIWWCKKATNISKLSTNKNNWKPSGMADVEEVNARV